jgi:glycosyltransferase involved in cell wall biosynthesis
MSIVGQSPAGAGRSGPLRVLSLYEGFFAGGARALHSVVVKELHTAGGQQHAVLSIFRELRRESLLQTMTADARYRSLRAAGVRIDSLGRAAGADRPGFSDRELAMAARHLRRSDLVLSLKEQPLRLVNAPGMPARPVVVCLHRSDPENQGPAFDDLAAAVAGGRVAAIVCCAQSTMEAYRAAGIPGRLLTVVPNGVDLTRFRPVPVRTRHRYRRALGLPVGAAVVVFAVRYDTMKNVPLFLAAARDFLAGDGSRHVVMCGAGMSVANTDLCGQLATYFADRPDLLRRLHPVGVRDDMPAIYAAADVVALTSSSGEAAPLCLIEGMMCGAVPVSTAVGDCASIVDRCGLVVAPRPEVVSAAWAEAVARRPEWTPALVRARTRFSHTRMAAAYAAVIERVSGRRPAPIGAGSRRA